jgi:hypothetical protein
VSAIEEGVSTITGSSALNCVVSIKNVTNKKAKSTIGVMSRDGLLRGIFIFGIVSLLNYRVCI